MNESSPSLVLPRVPLVKGRQEFRRIAGAELRWFQQALAHRLNFPCNVAFVGDSMTEAYGTTSDYKRWPYLVIQALQSRYRDGGVGYIPGRDLTIYSTNPDGKNRWSITAGALTDTVDYGFGFGRYSAWMANGCKMQITVDCDRFFWCYTAGTATGTATVKIDPGTPDEISATVGTTGSYASQCGRIYDSGQLELGTHVIEITATTGTVFNDGIMPFKTDTLLGIHGLQGGHSGYRASDFDGTDGTSTVKGMWADIFHQPYTPAVFTDGVANGTTTFTSATAAFTDNDIGEYLFFSGGTTTRPANGMARIVARGSGTSVTLDRTFASATGVRFGINRAQVADGVVWGPKTITDAVTTSGSPTLTSAAQGAFVASIVGATVTGTNIPSGTRVIAYNSATSVTLSQNATGSATVTATFTGSKNLQSATAAFNPWDINMYVQGSTNIPAGTYIARYNSATSVELSAAATSTGAASSQTVRIIGRQKFWMAPDLICGETGFNEDTVGVTPSTWKQNTKNYISWAIERAGIGYPVGYTSRYNPSVMLLSLWARGDQWDHAANDVVTTNGSAIITSQFFDFDPADVNKTITTVGNSPIPASTTIASVQSNRQATLSQNAVANSSAATATIISRQRQDKHWQKFRTAHDELASEMGWLNFDTYSLGGYIGTTDPYNLTFDLIHPNDHGSQWIADDFDVVLTGQPRNAPVSQGIADAKGDLFGGAALDVVGKISAGNDGTVPTWASGGSPIGILPMAPGMGAGIGQIIPSTAGGGAAITSGMVAPTLTATVTTVDDNEAQWLNFATSVVQFNPSGIVSPTFTITRAGRLPELAATIKTDPAVITSIMYAIGLSSASLDTATPGNSPAAAVQGAYFLYNTIDHGTAFWRTVTSDGTTRKTNVTTQSIAVNTTYRLRIRPIGVRGTSITGFEFFINDVRVAKHTANLPAVGTALGYGARVEALAAAAARSLKVARLTLAGP